MLFHPGLLFLDSDQSYFFKSHELNKEEHVTPEVSRILFSHHESYRDDWAEKHPLLSV